MNVGDEAPVKEVKLGRTDYVAYAGASGDFNPMHHDEVKAQAAKLPSVFGHGMLSMGVLGGALVDFVGVDNLRSYGARFVKQTWPGEVLTTSIVVESVDDGVATLRCTLANTTGEIKLTATATATL